MKNDNAFEFYPYIKDFAWVVPENKEFARIGMLDRINKSGLKESFNRFLEKKIGINPKSRIIEYQGGLVPVYNPSQQTQKGHVYLVGDAACQVKATTAGGIIQGLSAANCLADSIISCKSYEKEWRKVLGKDLWLHLKMRNIMDKFSENDWQYLIGLFRKKRNNDILNRYDRDYPSRFLLKMVLSEPRLLLFLKYVI